jgi:hypothetical protein
MPSGDIQVPYWEVLGGSEVVQSFVKNEMNDILNFLIQLAEWMLIHLVMHNVKKEFPYIVQEIADEDIDPKKPIKYQLSIDFSRLDFIDDLQSV